MTDQTTSILRRLESLSDRVQFVARRWRYSPGWDIDIEYSFDDIEVKVNAKDDTFEATLVSAWNKFERAIGYGMGTQALLPALEAPKPEANDDITF